MAGAVTAAMIHLGDRLGLFRALADARHPLTSAELAERTGLAERWVREWAYNQAAAGLIVADTGGDAERFSLPPAAVPVLADETHEMNLLGMFHQLPQSMGLLESALPESFRTGIGHDYDTLRARGGDRGRARLRAVDAQPPGRRPAAPARRRGRPARRRAWRRPTSGAARAPACCAWRGRSRPAASPATTSRATRSTGPRRAWRRPAWPTPSSTTRGPSRSRRTGRWPSSRRSTACTT